MNKQLFFLQLYSQGITKGPVDRKKVFKSKLTFQIQHEVFRYSQNYHLTTVFSLLLKHKESQSFYIFIQIYCRLKVREGSFNEITSILAWYEFINDIILDHLDDEIKSTNKSGVWRYCVVCVSSQLYLIISSNHVSVYVVKIRLILGTSSPSRTCCEPQKISELCQCMESNI